MLIYLKDEATDVLDDATLAEQIEEAIRQAERRYRIKVSSLFTRGA